MLIAQQDRSLFAYQIDPRRARRLLEVAVRRKAKVRVTPSNGGEAVLSGAVCSGTPESIWIDLDAPPTGTAAGLQSICCEVMLELDQSRFLFETNVLAVVEEDRGCRLEVARAETMQVLQRRRFWRATVHASAQVQLLRTDAQGREFWSAATSLLNISPAGVACLAEQPDADAICMEDIMQVRFQLPGVEEPFAMEAALRSKTPARDFGRMVLGFEFDHREDREQFHRLQAALSPST